MSQVFDGAVAGCAMLDAGRGMEFAVHRPH